MNNMCHLSDLYELVSCTCVLVDGLWSESPSLAVLSLTIQNLWNFPIKSQTGLSVVTINVYASSTSNMAGNLVDITPSTTPVSLPEIGARSKVILSGKFLLQ